MANFSSRLRKLRAERGITQSDLADILNTTKATISNYEKEKYEPGIETIIKLSDYFGVSTDYLLGKIDEKYLISENRLPEEIIDMIDKGYINYIEAIKDASQKGLSPRAVKEIIEVVTGLEKFNR